MKTLFTRKKYVGMRDEKTLKPSGGGELIIKETKWRWNFKTPFRSPFTEIEKSYIGSWDKARAGPGSGFLNFMEYNEA